MEILSPVHGKITYNEDEVINFEKPILGFDELKRFILKDIEESTFKLLQSIEDVNVGFVVVSPFMLEEKYEIKLSDEVIKTLEISNAKDVLLYSLVTLNSNVENITANLKAPIVINVNNKKAQQFIIDKIKYKIKHPLMKG